MAQKMAGVQSLQSKISDRLMLNSSQRYPATSEFPTETDSFSLHALALAFSDCPGSKRIKVRTEQNRHQKEGGSLSWQHAWTKRYSGQLDGFHTSDRFWQKQAQRGNTCYPLWCTKMFLGKSYLRCSVRRKFSHWLWLTKNMTAAGWASLSHFIKA